MTSNASLLAAQDEMGWGMIVAIVAGLVMIVMLLLVAQFFRLWLQAYMSKAGVTMAETDCCCTVTAAVPLTPSVVAVMVADPLVTAVTKPEELTVATIWPDEDQVNVLPESVFPLAS